MNCYPSLSLSFVISVLLLPMLCIATNTLSYATSDLATAYMAAAAGDIITLKSGSTFSGTCSTHTDSSICLTAPANVGTTIACNDALAKCELDGRSARRVAYISSAAGLTLSHLAITNGAVPITVATPVGGGGFYVTNSGGMINANGCFFYNNASANSGGAVYIARSSVTFTACSFTSNVYDSGASGSSTVGGGAIYVSSTAGAGVFVSASNFSSNSCGRSSCPNGNDVEVVAGAITFSPMCPGGFASSRGAKGSTALSIVAPSTIIAYPVTCPYVCPAGKYRSSSDTTCQSCAAGTYLDDAATDFLLHNAASDCTSCGVGEQGSNASSNGVEPCDMDSRLGDVGATALAKDEEAECANCPKGSCAGGTCRGGATSDDQKVYYLSCLAIFKNEVLGLKVWLDHYLWQGVEHFYLIDNGSTDRPLETVLQPYIDRGFVTYEYRPETHAQLKHYAHMFRAHDVKAKSEWLLVCDLDEFVFAKGRGARGLVDRVAHLASAWDAIYLFWLIFASIEYHPPEILEQHDVVLDAATGHPLDVRMLTVRRSYYEPEPKYVVRTSIVRDPTNLGAHGLLQHADSDRILDDSDALSLHHYVTQSRHYFENVKMARGDVNSLHYETVRDWDYYARLNAGMDVVDTSLRQLIE